jgi:hypothetical protein
MTKASQPAAGAAHDAAADEDIIEADIVKMSVTFLQHDEFFWWTVTLPYWFLLPSE